MSIIKYLKLRSLTKKIHSILNCWSGWNYSVTKQYDMTFSYTLLIPMLICLIFAIYESKYFYLVIFLFLEIINLICGNRGSILCHLICFLLCMFFYSNKTRFIKWIFSFTLILFIVLK